MTLTNAEMHLLLVEMDDLPLCPDCASEPVVHVENQVATVCLAHDATCPAVVARTITKET